MRNYIRQNFDTKFLIPLGVAGGLLVGGIVSYSMNKHDALGHTIAYIASEPYETIQQRARAFDAQRLQERANALMEKYDANHDSVVTRDELLRALEK